MLALPRLLAARVCEAEPELNADELRVPLMSRLDADPPPKLSRGEAETPPAPPRSIVPAFGPLPWSTRPPRAP